MGKIAAVVLAAGQGKRMNSKIQKQYLLVQGRPLITYALDAFEQSAVDTIILVVGQGEVPYCQKEIVDAYGYQKVSAVVEGGKERYHSVYEGLKQLENCEIVLIHDGARPFVNQTIIHDAIEGAEEYEACVIGMPVKDTIKIADSQGFAAQTPDRSLLWQIQTPQAFSYPLIRRAYDKLFEAEEHQIGVTDDAMVVESMTSHHVKLIRGDYHNIKVTTPEDIVVAEAFLSHI